MRFVFIVLFLLPGIAKAQTAEEWIRLGEQVHGGFGTLIPLGIRIGLDARERLKAAPRELDVGFMGEALIKHRKTGEQLRYRIPAAAYGQILQWNKGTTPAERFKLVMEAPAPFTVE